jgi:Domain of unknown function (DUF4375)
MTNMGSRNEGTAASGPPGAPLNASNTMNNMTGTSFPFSEAIDELEMEVNNGGFNQYFFNSSGVNCFTALRELRERGKARTADLLEAAIKAIDPNGLPEADLIRKLREQEVSALDDDAVNEKLDILDAVFFTYPDGPLDQ